MTASEAARLELPVLGVVALALEPPVTPIASLDGPAAEMSVESELLGVTASTEGAETDAPVTVKSVAWATGAGLVMLSTGACTTVSLVEDTATVSVVDVGTVSVSTVVVSAATVVEAGWIVRDDDGALTDCWADPELTVSLEGEALVVEAGAVAGGVEEDWLLGWDAVWSVDPLEELSLDVVED